MCASNTCLGHWGHLFTPAKIQIVRVWIFCVTCLHVWAHLSLCLFYVCRSIKSLPAAKEFLTPSGVKTDTACRPLRTTSAVTLRVTTALSSFMLTRIQNVVKSIFSIHGAILDFTGQYVILDVLKHMLLWSLRIFRLTFRHPKITSTTSTFSCIRMHRLLLEVQLQRDMKQKFSVQTSGWKMWVGKVIQHHLWNRMFLGDENVSCNEESWITRWSTF